MTSLKKQLYDEILENIFRVSELLSGEKLNFNSLDCKESS